MPSKIAKNQPLLQELEKDFPNITFCTSDSYYWSPKDRTVFIGNHRKGSAANWSLLHELSHGILNHETYGTDFELLQLEVAAWQKAKEIGAIYGENIDEDHIQDCLDTYRDWLHARSTCPNCKSRGIQVSESRYECSRCDGKWQVSSARFCRPYRMVNRAAYSGKNR